MYIYLFNEIFQSINYFCYDNDKNILIIWLWYISFKSTLTSKYIKYINFKIFCNEKRSDHFDFFSINHMNTALK